MSASLDPFERTAILQAGFDYIDQLRFGDAEALGRELLATQAHDIEALLLVGIALGAQGDRRRAAPILNRVAHARPDYAHPCRDLAQLLRAQGRDSEIAPQFHQALALSPGDTNLRYAFADHLQESGDPQAAVDVLVPALRQCPEFDVGHNLMGIALFELGRLEDATRHFTAAVRLDPEASVGWANLGMARKTKGQFEAAIAAYDRALAGSPDDPQIRLNRSIAMLRAGRMREAWPDYECRLRLPGHPLPVATSPLLPCLSALGDITGLRILVTHEEGFGDTLQFLRYVPLLVARGAIVRAVVPDPLRRLLAGHLDLLPAGAALPPHDYHCPFFSLPRVFETELDSIPVAAAYLAALPGSREHWASRLPPPGRLRVGLVWAGQARPWLPGFIGLDRRRSLSLAALAPLAQVPDVAFISLQTGPAAAQRGLAVHDVAADITDFADTAGIIANLDIVISVDTAVAHLAAAMGKPVFLLDRADSCWRWLHDRDDSPWYPSLTIFRQPTMGDWAPVLAKVANALRAWPR
jgi:uncharacterized protein (TIGR02996 family)